MTDREQRLVDELRRRPDQPPPPGLADAIKKEIPGAISGTHRSSIRSGWLIAATLITMVGAGWLALQLFRTDPPVSPRITAEPELSAKQESLNFEKDESFADKPMDAQAAGMEKAGATEGLITGGREESRNETSEAAQSPAPIRQSAPPPSADENEPIAAASRAIAAPSSPVARESEAATAKQADSPVPPPPPQAVIPRESGTGPEGVRRELESRVQSLSDSSNTEISTVTYDELRQSISAGRLPEPAAVDVDTLINHLDYGDRAPWRRGKTSLFIEGGAAPFKPGRWRTVRIGLRSGTSHEVIGKNAGLEVSFDPDSVSLYRRVGTSSVRSAVDAPSTVIPVGRIEGDDARSWLFEIKLRTDVDLDQSVVNAELGYDVTNEDRVEISRSLRLGHIAPTWSTSSTSLRSAVLAGTLAESLRAKGSRLDDLELLHRAQELREASDAGDAVLDLIELIEETVTLRNRRAPRH